MSRASVILEEYDSSWPMKFEKEKEHLIAIAGKWFYGSIEHVGSTAIPGMVAKPVIDIMFGVKSFPSSSNKCNTHPIVHLISGFPTE